MTPVSPNLTFKSTLFLYELPALASIPQPQDLAMWLSEDEIVAAGRYLHPGAHALNLASRVLVRRLLAAMHNVSPLALRFGRTARGRPFLIEPAPGNIDFNLAHSEKWVGLLVAPFPIGLDLEPLNRKVKDIHDIASAYFSANEAKWIAEQPLMMESRFFTLWTLKEAYLKACGRGIGDSLASVEFTLEGNNWYKVDDKTSPGIRSWRGTILRPDTDLCVAACQPVTAPLDLPAVIRIANPFDPEFNPQFPG